MPSPFPGMDPYLENPALWPTVHHALISFLWTELNRLLPETYVAQMGERVFLLEPPKSLYPDVLVVRHPRRAEPRNGKAVALVEADAAYEIEFGPEEVREVYVEIHLAHEPGALVAVVEILSPANKTEGPGRELYLEKQRLVLDSPAHLVEIDLLRGGEYTAAAPLERLPESGWDYLVSAHRGGGNRYRCWPVSLRDRLPRFAIPLRGEDADVVVDLQALFEHCYDAGNFARRIDYSKPCVPTLGTGNARWARKVVRDLGKGRKKR